MTSSLTAQVKHGPYQADRAQEYRRQSSKVITRNVQRMHATHQNSFIHSQPCLAPPFRRGLCTGTSFTHAIETHTPLLCRDFPSVTRAPTELLFFSNFSEKNSLTLTPTHFPNSTIRVPHILSQEYFKAYFLILNFYLLGSSSPPRLLASPLQPQVPNAAF